MSSPTNEHRRFLTVSKSALNLNSASPGKERTPDEQGLSRGDAVVMSQQPAELAWMQPSLYDACFGVLPDEEQARRAADDI